MKKIEFIGASGVGKTTLFNDILKNRSEHASWITPTEARIQLAKTGQIDVPKFSMHGVMQTFLKLNVFKKRHAFLSDHVLRNLETKVLLESMSQYNDIIDLSLKEIAMDENVEPYKKVSFIDFYMNLILHDILTIEKFSDHSLIVYDDGLIHNSYAVNDESKFHLMLEKNPALIEKVLPQGAVFCELSVEDNLARRKSRISKGRGHLLEIQQNDENLYKFCEESIHISNQIITIFEKYGIPVLRLNMNDSNEKNIALFNQFIESFV